MRGILTRLGASKLIHAGAIALMGGLGGLPRAGEPLELLRIDRSQGIGAGRFEEEWIEVPWSRRSQKGRVEGIQPMEERIAPSAVKFDLHGCREGIEEDSQPRKPVGMDWAAVSDRAFEGLSCLESIGAAGGVSGRYGRGTGRRARLRIVASGNRAALDRALSWLARHQDRLGYWNPSARCFACNDEGNVTMGVVEGTALCVLAFLAAGHDHGSARFGSVVRRGLEFLMLSQDPSGRVGWSSESHALGAQALWRAARRTYAPILVDAALRARKFEICETALPGNESRDAIRALAGRWQVSRPGSCSDGSWEPAWQPGSGRMESTAKGALLLARLFGGS